MLNLDRNVLGSTASIDVAQAVRTFGYAVVPNLLDTEEVEKVRLLAASSDPGEGPGLAVLGVSELSSSPDVVFKAAANSLVLDAVERLIGPFAQLDNLSIITVHRGSGAGISWHRDPYASLSLGEVYQKPLMLNLLIYLQSLSEEIGPLRVIPKSHMTSVSIRGEALKEPRRDELLLCPSAGDAVLIHNNLVHSRSQNISNHDRIHISVLYNHTFMKQHLPLDLPLISRIRAAVRSSGDIRLARLFGCGPNPDRRYNCGFLVPDEELWLEWATEEANGAS